MAETVEQYIARMVGHVGGEDPLKLLEAAPERLRILVSDATAEELAWKPSPDRWSINEIAAHLADSEIVGGWRFRAVLAQDGAPLQAFDQNVWAAAFRYEQAPAAESAALFAAVRGATLRLLRAVDPTRLAHAGMHAERGREPIAHLLRLNAGHDLNHLAQIERLLTEARSRT